MHVSILVSWIEKTEVQLVFIKCAKHQLIPLDQVKGVPGNLKEDGVSSEHITYIVDFAGFPGGWIFKVNFNCS
jgi:hypothetical protein